MSKPMNMKLHESKKKAVVHVLGCKVNQAEAAAMARILENRGYEIDAEALAPDLVVINTCCVTSRAEGKSRRTISRLTARYPHARIVVTGCLAEMKPASLDAVAQRCVILGTYEKDRFHEALERALSGGEEVPHQRASRCTTFGDLGAPGIQGRTRAFLKVQDGCSQRCAYCIVPTTRGPSRSIEIQRALAHARTLRKEGYTEIVLTGIHLGSYGRDLAQPTQLEYLVENLLAECPDVRFRLSSVEPQEVTRRLIALVAREDRLCSHFHIPLQSGDDPILKRMRRPYTAQHVKDLAHSILETIPDACIGFDVMVGFPGEDEDSFGRTVDLIRSTAAAYLHVFPFSPRPGTPAATFTPRVPEKVAHKRVSALRSLSDAMRIRFYSRCVGRTLDALLESETQPQEGMVCARTGNYIPVRLRESDRIPRGSLFRVKLERLEGGEVIGACPDGTGK